jgi:DNA mismatch repair protein MutS
LKQGAANQSYGLQVAKLAGVPVDVLASAREKLATLETHRLEMETEPRVEAQVHQKDEKVSSKVEAVLASLNPDELTPKAALEQLYALKLLLASKQQDKH